MKKLMIVWGIIAVMLTGTLTFIGFKMKASLEGYHSLEMDMIEAAGIYLKLEDIDLSINEKIKVPIKKLLEKDCLNHQTVDEDTCEGYVVISRNLDGNDYHSYIKCANYETEGYDKE